MPMPRDPDFIKVVPVDPFPSLTFARIHLWGFLDHFAWRRLQRLGVPTPQHAYMLGYQAAQTENALAQRREIDVTAR